MLKFSSKLNFKNAIIFKIIFLTGKVLPTCSCFLLSVIVHSLFAFFLIFLYWPVYDGGMDYSFTVSKDFVVDKQFMQTATKNDGKVSFGRYFVK